MWYEMRAGRITASVFKQACHSPPSKPAKSLVTQICYPDSTKFCNKATRYTHSGREHVILIVFDDHFSLSKS